MSVFMILAVALLGMAVAVALLSLRELRRAARRLQSTGQAALGRLAPLREEFRSEAAVTSIEVSQIQASIERLRTARRPRHHHGSYTADGADGGSVRSELGEPHEHWAS